VRLRWPIAAVGVGSLLLAGANLFLHGVGDPGVIVAAIAVGVAAAGMFLAAVFDTRFQRAVSTLNAARRAQARQKGLSGPTGQGLQPGDRVLATVNAAVLAGALVAGNWFHRGPPTALLAAALALGAVAQIALTVQRRDTDRRPG